jgi:hypothetical protein
LALDRLLSVAKVVAAEVAVVITIMMTMLTIPTRMPTFTTIRPYDPYEYQQEYSGPDYGGNDNNDRDDRQPTPPPLLRLDMMLRLGHLLRLHQLPMTPTKMRAFMVMAATSKSILALITVEAATTLCLMRICCRK